MTEQEALEYYHHARTAYHWAIVVVWCSALSALLSLANAVLQWKIRSLLKRRRDQDSALAVLEREKGGAGR